jgi:SAM-dependent methyltransferase
MNIQHKNAKAAWNNKSGFRFIHKDLYTRILASLKSGSVVEIGSGMSEFKSFCPNVTTSDIINTGDLDVIADAQSLPFADKSFDNIVMIDVLHHIPRPNLFFNEADRILRHGGNLVLIEPAITPISYIFYKYFHPESIDLSSNPLAQDALSSDSPYDSNQAIPTLLMTRYKKDFLHFYPRFTIRKIEWLSFFAYPLSGGIRSWSLINEFWAAKIIKIENLFPSRLARLLAFRMLIVIERRDDD